jgi:hypothetical protein
MYNKDFNKIVGVGWHKTGTTSLERMLEILGYRVCGFDNTLLDSAIQKDVKTLFKIASTWDALSDMPWNIYYKELDKQFPNSKFILTLRKEEGWKRSMINHFGKTKKKSIKWLYGIDDPELDQDGLIPRFKRHNEEVLDYFKEREGDLLVIEWKDSVWKELCWFLGKKTPKFRFSGIDVEIPKANSERKRKLRNSNFFGKHIKPRKVSFRLFLTNHFYFNSIFALNFFKLLRKTITKYFYLFKYVK